MERTVLTSYEDWVFPLLLMMAGISLLDGILVMGNQKSSSSILFPTSEESENVGVKHFLYDTADLLTALIDGKSTEVLQLTNEDIDWIPQQNFSSSTLNMFVEKAEEWNGKHGASKHNLIHTGSEQLVIRKSAYRYQVIPAQRWSDRDVFEERGHVTAIRIQAPAESRTSSNYSASHYSTYWGALFSSLCITMG